MVDDFGRNYRIQKRALTIAEHRGFDHVIVQVCDDALASFARFGWPDDWSRWERARTDALGRIARA